MNEKEAGVGPLKKYKEGHCKTTLAFEKANRDSTDHGSFKASNCITIL